MLRPRRAAPWIAAALIAGLASGCGAAADPSSPGTPTPTAPSATARPTPAAPTPTPASAAARAVLDGLAALAADADRSYRITFEGDSRHTTDILAVQGTLDVSGDDAQVRATFTFPGQGTGRTDYRRVGARDWIRVDSGRWRSVPDVDAATVVDPLAGARAAGGVQYLGPVEGSPDRHRVRLSGMILHPLLIPAGNLDDEEVVRTRLELVTDAAGRPVSGTWSFSGTGRVSGQLQAIEMDLELTFSRIGKPVRIQAP